MDFLLLENGDYLLLEDGGRIILRSGPVCPALLLEDGSYLLLENGDHLLLEGDCGCVPYTPIGPALLLEDGFYLLLEDCSHLLLEDGATPVRPQQGRGNQRRGKIGQPEEAFEEEDWELIIALWLQIK